MSDRGSKFDIQKLLSRDEGEWERVFVCHKYAILKIIARHGYGKEEANDLFAAACSHAWERFMAHFDAERGSRFSGWFVRVARNYVVDEWRRDNKRPGRAMEIEDGAEVLLSKDHGFEEFETNELIRALMARLTERPRMVFLLRLDGYDNQEIAKMLKCSKSAVATAYERAKRKLQELLQEFG